MSRSGRVRKGPVNQIIHRRLPVRDSLDTAFIGRTCVDNGDNAEKPHKQWNSARISETYAARALSQSYEMMILAQHLDLFSPEAEDTRKPYAVLLSLTRSLLRSCVVTCVTFE